MSTLRELRTAMKWNQSDMAKVINTNAPAYCNIENGLATPIMEDMVIFEKKFNQRIDWEENISLEEKAEIMVGIQTLVALYPISAVLTFTQKALREGQRLGQPAILIKNYASMAARIVDEEVIKPIPPTGIKFKEEED
jgi:transcriptional regulator with XRE-family HTH domain